MATATMPPVPGTVTTILDLKTGQVAEVIAILGRPECHWGMPADVAPGMRVRCIEHDPDGTTLELPDGELVRIPRDYAGYLQIERTFRRPRGQFHLGCRNRETDRGRSRRDPPAKVSVRRSRPPLRAQPVG